MIISRTPEKPSPRRPRNRNRPGLLGAARVFLLYVVVAPAALLAVSCGFGGPDVEGRWTGGLELNYGSGYDVALNLAQDGEDLSGTGMLVARDAGEDDVPVEVAEGSRVDGEALDLVLRDASGYSGLRIDLQGTAEEERIEADGTFGASTQTGENNFAARLNLAR